MTTPIDYTARDFDTIKAALRGYLQGKFPSDWKDVYESSVGQAILELIAYAFDNLSFALDYTANELFLDTARDRASVWKLGRLVGYQMRTPTSASVVCTATLPAIYAQDVVIAAGTTVQSLNGVDFLLAEDGRIAAGSLTGSLLFVQGVRRTQNITADGTEWQSNALASYPVVQGTVEVTVDGAEWDEVESLAYADGDEEKFAVKYDENGVATVLFGDGIWGKPPPDGAAIVVTYRTGGGVQGNITLNQINGTVSGVKEGVMPEETVNVSVINDTERGSGGEDIESVTHAKLWIPRWSKAHGRAVTEDDYDVLANAFRDTTYGSPAFAKARLKQNIPELNTVELVVWGRDSEGNIAVASTGLKTALSTYFNNNGPGAVKVICTHTEVIDGNIVYLDIDVTVKVDSDYVSSDVLSAVRTKIQDYFSGSNAIPGRDYRLSVLYRDVMAVPGVTWAIVNTVKASYRETELIGIGDNVETTFADTIVLEPGSSIIPGSATVYYGTPVATETLTDNGSGALLDESDVEVGTIDYTTGAVSATFAAAPATGINVYARYRYILDYQRGENVGTGTGSTRRFKGTLTYPPLNPYDVATGQKGVAFSDGTQTVIDDGDGGMIGDIDPTGVNHIDYDTGAFDFTFLLTPALGATIACTYRQLLDVDSEDIPIDKNQVVSMGTVAAQATSEEDD